MGSLCFSSASILRCESLSRLEVELLIIPTAIEVIFSTSLIFTNWGSGWRHLLLTAEGWTYLALALLDLFSHIIPAARDDLSVFKVLDIFIGATSFLPILFYAAFLFIFTTSELIDTLPRTVRAIARPILFIFIPAIVGFNEVSSFVGISHRTILSAGKPVLSIGFRTAKDQTLFTFFSSLTLALLTAYQAINFCFAFYRLAMAFVDKRRIEATSRDEAHLVLGIGWITGGLKLGAIETVIGFANAGFGTAMTRRILRVLSRAFLIIGVVKGVDKFEDFREVREEMARGSQGRRKSAIRQFISNPRFSTFRQLSPTATAFHARSPGGLPGMSEFASVKEGKSKQRVTVHYDERNAPTLHMRFSVLDIPSPAVLVDTVGKTTDNRPRSMLTTGSISPYPFSPGPAEISTAQRAHIPQAAPQLYRTYGSTIIGSRPSTFHAISEHSRSHSSLDQIHVLATQFPGLPPRVTKLAQRVDEPSTWDDPYSTGMPSPESAGRQRGGSRFLSPSNSIRATTAGSLTPSNSLKRATSLSKRKPVPRVEDREAAYDGLDDTQIIPVGETSADSTPSNTPMTMAASVFSYPRKNLASSVLTPDTENPFVYDEQEFPAALNTGKSRELLKTRTSSVDARTVEWIGSTAKQRVASSTSMSGEEPDEADFREELRDRIQSTDTIDIPWLRHSEIRHEDDLRKALAKRPIPSAKASSIARIKSVGKAPKRYTPSPIKGTVRGSILLQPIMIPPKQVGMTEIIQGSLTSKSDGGVLRDSEVLGVEDRSMARDSGYYAMTSEQSVFVDSPGQYE